MSLQRSLFRKYLLVLIGVICGTLLAASLAHILLTLHEQRERADALLAAESRLASLRIESFLSSIVEPMSWILDHDQPGMAADLAQIHAESQRFLRKAPSVSALRYVGADGCVQLEVSRIGLDRIGGCSSQPLRPREQALLKLARGGRAAFGPVLFHDGSLPFMDIAMAARGRHGGVLLAEVDLRQIHATIAAIRIGAAGHAYVVDDAWQLVAHPDNSLVLRHLDLRGVPTVQAERAVPGGAGGATLGAGIGGHLVLSTAAAVAGPDWHVFVQLPAREALQPIVALLWLTLLVIVVAMLGATAASYWLARRMTRPILTVRAGAARMAAGDLGTRIDVATGDEVELLAHEFNYMAAALGDSYAQLEDKVRQRTRALELASTQLAQQARELTSLNDELSSRLGELALRKEEAERASAAKTRFLAAASHDLLQPMHAVGLLVGILRQRIRHADIGELVCKVEAAVKGMETLFGSLLDVSKLDSQTVKVDCQEVELDNVLRFVELHFQPIAVEKGIVLRVARCRHTVLTDPALLERIVANLVSNAIRYTDRGKVLVGCRRQGDTVQIRVYDTGIGIPEQFQEQIFEEFYQVEGTARRTGKSHGLGLGLSIVRRSVELLGLALELRSRPGAGSMFGVALALHRPDAARAALQATALARHEHLHGAFIAIVDDDRDACDAMELLLRAAGCHVVAGLASDSVRDQLADHLRTPDLILTDLRLGRHDSGLRAIAGIRADCEKDIPALIVTGESHPPPAQELPRLCSLARKPLGPERLLELCDTILSAASSPRNAVPAALPR